MSRRCLPFILLFFLSGCTQAKQLAHLDQLMTLKAVSDNRDEQAKFVEEQNKKFDRMLEVFQSGRLVEEYPDKKRILKSFGQPILVKNIEEDGQPQEEWLYRYATKYFNTDKIYLYFDGQGQLVNFQYVAPVAQEVASSAASAEGKSHGQDQN